MTSAPGYDEKGTVKALGNVKLALPWGRIMVNSWVKLEPIIQSEVSQKDKDHYNILTHIYGI